MAHLKLIEFSARNTLCCPYRCI